MQHSEAVQPVFWAAHVIPAGEALMSLTWLPQSNAPPVAPVMSAQVFEAANFAAALQVLSAQQYLSMAHSSVVAAAAHLQAAPVMAAMSETMQLAARA